MLYVPIDFRLQTSVLYLSPVVSLTCTFRSFMNKANKYPVYTRTKV